MKTEDFKTTAVLSVREGANKLSLYWDKDFGKLLDERGWTHFAPFARISSTLYGTLEPITEHQRGRWKKNHKVFKFQRKANGSVHAEIPFSCLGLVLGIPGVGVETLTSLHECGNLQVRVPTRNELKAGVDRWMEKHVAAQGAEVRPL